MRLSGKRLLVVGASSGLGRATALQAAAEGARVCFASRRVERIEQAAREAGNGAFAVACDVRDEASCGNAVARAVQEMGGLDGFVYSPATSTFGPIEGVDAAEWRKVFETNVIGVSLLLNAAIDPLSAARGKAVIFSSIVIDDSPPRPQQASYVVSKSALERLIEAWQGEHRSVGFTAIASGDTITEFGTDHDMETLVPIVQRWGELEYLYGRMMEADSVAAQAINALASPETVRRIAITPAFPEGDGSLDSHSAEFEFEQMGRTEGDV
ncbi:MAG: short-chain dehydrogenase [Deltaproteobacteria bacterium]|nr:short-chain dehydrogenase [Deltaproteobacteria bacterium]